MKDYVTMHYHMGKANVVADALSRKSSRSLVALITRQQPKLLMDLEKLQIVVKPTGDSGHMGRVNQVLSLIFMIKSSRHS